MSSKLDEKLLAALFPLTVEAKKTKRPSLEEYMIGLERYGAGFELEQGGRLVWQCKNDIALKQVQVILDKSPELKKEIYSLARKEYFEREKPLVHFDYPSMKHCYLSNQHVRMKYREYCIKQWGVPYHICFEEKPPLPLIEAGLIEKRTDYFVLTWNENKCEQAIYEYEARLGI